MAALEKFGVPRSAIVTLDEPVEITETELRRVVAAAKARGWRRVILVTSAFHARRVRLIWSREAAGAVEAGLAVTHDECSSRGRLVAPPALQRGGAARVPGALRPLLQCLEPDALSGPRRPPQGRRR